MKKEIKKINFDFNPESLKTIRAFGNFLSFYYKDLKWIDNFQNFIKGNSEIKTYLNDEEWGFNKFLTSYKISRNRSKNKKMALLRETSKYITSNEELNINDFAKILKKRNVTKGFAVSLSSKVLFLNNPWLIFPFDSIVKELFNIKKKNYDEYLVKVSGFKLKYGNEMNDYLNKFIDYIKIIEKEFPNLDDIETIRLNRFIDIYLWSVGGSS